MVRRLLPALALGWGLLWGAGLGLPGCLVADAAPRERLDQAWRILVLTKDSGLSERTLFNVAFRTNLARPGVWTAWIATSDGLHEYDGYSWRRHGREQGLPSDFVRCVHVTRSGDLWVGSDRGAGIYDGRSYRSLGSEQGLASINVRRIVEDRDGALWFSSDTWPHGQGSGGLTVLRDGQWKRYGREDGLPGDYVINFHRDTRGDAFVVTLQGIARLRGDRWVAETVEGTTSLEWDSACFAESPAPVSFSRAARMSIN